MGNSAIITLDDSPKAVGLYLHWNGGPESVLGFLAAGRDLQLRSPKDDPDYFLGRFAQIIGNFFGGNTSLGINLIEALPEGDNGTYVVGGDFRIVKRTKRGPQDFIDLTPEQAAKYHKVRDAAVEKSKPFFFTA